MLRTDSQRRRRPSIETVIVPHPLNARTPAERIDPIYLYILLPVYLWPGIHRRVYSPRPFVAVTTSRLPFPPRNYFYFFSTLDFFFFFIINFPITLAPVLPTAVSFQSRFFFSLTIIRPNPDGVVLSFRASERDKTLRIPKVDHHCTFVKSFFPPSFRKLLMLWCCFFFCTIPHLKHPSPHPEPSSILYVSIHSSK